MRTVTLEVSSREETDRRVRGAFEGRPQGAVISFETPALLFKVLTQKRWELLAALTGAGPVTLREAARRVKRDVKAVHADVLRCSTPGSSGGRRRGGSSSRSTPCASTSFSRRPEPRASRSRTAGPRPPRPAPG